MPDARLARWRVRFWLRIAKHARALGWHAATGPAELGLRHAYNRLVEAECKTSR